MTVNIKLELITAWFDEVEGILVEIKGLSNKRYYKQIAMPSLYAILERLAWIRYRHESLSSKERFKKLLLTYSKNFIQLEKIDIAFLYQWDVSKYNEIPKYKKAIKKIHGKMKQVLVDLYGSISISMSNRFIDKYTLYQALLTKDICLKYFDIEKLELFSVCEVIYRFGRCKAVHEGDFVMLGFISIDLLIKITKDITANLKKICLKQGRFPFEL